MKPRALDLFCGAGGATKGLQDAGFHVTGIDNRPQPRYVGDHFIQADALRPPVELAAFDLIWASPPCQAYSYGNEAARRAGRVEHPDLLPATRSLLEGHRLTVIENVPGAPMRIDAVLDGTMFPNLRVIRRRHFEMTFSLPLLLGFDARGHVKRHGWSSPRNGNTICSRDRRWRLARGLSDVACKPANARAAMLIDWPMTTREVANAIPPAYSEFIGRAALRYLQAEAA